MLAEEVILGDGARDWISKEGNVLGFAREPAGKSHRHVARQQSNALAADMRPSHGIVRATQRGKVRAVVHVAALRPREIGEKDIFGQRSPSRAGQVKKAKPWPMPDSKSGTFN